MAITFATWNFGDGVDYFEMMQRTSKGIEPEEIIDKRDQVAKQALNAFIIPNSIDILCLQKVGKNLDKIYEVLKNHFEIQYDPLKNTAVAYRSRFVLDRDSKINLSIFCQNDHGYTILTLRDKLTEKIYTVASAYIPRFNLEDLGGSKTSPEVGDKELKNLLAELATKDSDGTIIGIDTNTTEEHHKKARLDLLENAGYKTNKENRANTTFNNFLRREIKTSYIFTKCFNLDPFEVTNLSLEDPYNNPSCHIPVIERLELDQEFKKELEGSKWTPGEAAHRAVSGIANLTPSPSPAGKEGTIDFSNLPKLTLDFPSDDEPEAERQEKPLPEFDTGQVEELQEALVQLGAAPAASDDDRDAISPERAPEEPLPETGKENAAVEAEKAPSEVPAKVEVPPQKDKPKVAPDIAKRAAALRTLSKSLPSPTHPVSAAEEPKPPARVSWSDDSPPSKPLPTPPARTRKAEPDRKALLAEIESRRPDPVDVDETKEKANTCMNYTMRAVVLIAAVVLPLYGSFYRVE